MVTFKENSQIVANRELIGKLLILFQHCDHENDSTNMLKIVKLDMFLYSNMHMETRPNGG